MYVLSMCHERFLEQGQYIEQQSKALETLSADNQKLLEQYKQAMTRAWYERPEYVVPAAIVLGLLGGVWASK